MICGCPLTHPHLTPQNIFLKDTTFKMFLLACMSSNVAKSLIYNLDIKEKLERMQAWRLKSEWKLLAREKIRV